MIFTLVFIGLIVSTLVCLSTFLAWWSEVLNRTSPKYSTRWRNYRKVAYGSLVVMLAWAGATGALLSADQRASLPGDLGLPDSDPRRGSVRYWSAVVEPLSRAQVGISDFEIKNFDEMNFKILTLRSSEAAGFAAQAYAAARGQTRIPVPAGWEDVQADLEEAATEVHDVMSGMSLLGTESPQQRTETSASSLESAYAKLGHALKKARAHHAKLGGDPAVLKTFGLPLEDPEATSGK